MPSWADRFKAMDANGDGSISKAEFDAYNKTRFTQLDTNKDGFLTADEISAGMGGHGGEGMVKRYDTNNDGKISADEFTAGQDKRFDEMDTDHDGSISKAEQDAAIAKANARMGGH